MRRPKARVARDRIAAIIRAGGVRFGDAHGDDLGSTRLTASVTPAILVPVMRRVGVTPQAAPAQRSASGAPGLPP